MGDEWMYDFETGPYCRCCGSRDVMTLDVFIEKNNDWEDRSRLKEKRVWLSLSDLNEFELDAFVAEALPGGFDGDSDELACEMVSELSFAVTNSPPKYWSHAREEPLSIEDIGGSRAEELTRERKRGFMRLWDSFDADTRSSFLMRVTPVGKPSGSCN